MTQSPGSNAVRGRRYLSSAAAAAFLTGASHVRVGTVARWAAYVANPVVPTMVELAGWRTWRKLPLLPTFHVIYWWAGLVCLVMLYESISRGRQAVRWQEFWIDRGSSLPKSGYAKGVLKRRSFHILSSWESRFSPRDQGKAAMVADKSSNNTSKPARGSRGASGTLAYLRRIGTYL